VGSDQRKTARPRPIQKESRIRRGNRSRAWGPGGGGLVLPGLQGGGGGGKRLLPLGNLLKGSEGLACHKDYAIIWGCGENKKKGVTQKGKVMARG